ncbi:MAG: peptide-N-glycosidase F-related protein [Bacteroidota bacterium]|jgi:hypothetical protein
MKRFLLALSLLATCYLMKAQQHNPGDTIVVQTFTFGSPQNAWFVLPSDSIQFEKIIMKYKLKCNPAQNPACGEWDYLTNTYLYDHTGLIDSSAVLQPTIIVNSTSPDSVFYSNSPTYSYSQNWQYFSVNTSTVSLNADTIGNGSTNSHAPFSTANPVSRSQYLWKATELSAVGLSAGNITGLQFFIQSPGNMLRNLRIRLKHTNLDSLTNSSFSSTGFTEVYLKNTQLITGWNSIQLTNPFNWDGTSNIIIEIFYDNLSAGTNYLVSGDNTIYKSGLTKSGSDRSIYAVQGGYVDVPLNNSLASIDSTITVAFWAYGDTALQPMNGTCFEGVDSLNQRVINTHLPWGDASVYWDAGNSLGSSYDRINKAATISEYEGKWNYWAFTKNVATGSMKIYLNGNLWHSGTGKTKTMQGMKKFKLAKGNWGGSQSYSGRMNDFMVLNKELTSGEIIAYMNNPINSSDSNYAHLSAHFGFDDGNGYSAVDSASGNHANAILSGVQNQLVPSFEYERNFDEVFTRPQVVFEQGVYTSHIDSIQVLDSAINIPYVVFAFNDSTNNPSIPSDTLIGWPVNSVANADTIIYLNHYTWYTKFPQIIRYELARYITPYGNGLSLGTGWIWTFDLSDYATLLHDSVHLSAGNWQELLDMQLLFIVGTPPRNVLGIQNLWNGNFDYGFANNPIENHLIPLTVNIPSNAVNSRWKSRVTGHGMDTPSNCAEFCPRSHYYKVNGVQHFSKLAWRDNCDLNPLYPQGGTWVYDRSNWCPGAEVWTYDWELTPHVTPGTSSVLDHDLQPYTNTSGWDYWQIEDQVVFYGAPNFNLDASVEDILSPTADQMWKRYNPICTNPVIRIKNTGSTTLTSLTITYGLVGATPSVYTWTGTLPFMESTTVTLGNFNWLASATEFTVAISNPNGGTDQYQPNNNRASKFTAPLVMPSKFVIEFKTNSYSWENQYTLKNSAGNVIFSQSSLSPNTIYRDTVDLPSDCYEFELTDSGEDGLTWWANQNQGSGYVRFRSALNNSILKSFGQDFGGQIYQQINIGLNVGTQEFIYNERDVMNVYPNPANDLVYIDINLLHSEDGTIEIKDMLGKTVFIHTFKSSSTASLEADLSTYSKGMYYVTLKTKDKRITRKLMLD